MKITPVQGVPTIQQPSNSGVSQEKLDRLKTIARGEKPQELAAEEREKIKLGDVATSATRSIKMSTNRTPEQDLVQAIADAQPQATETTAAPPAEKPGDGPLPTDTEKAAVPDKSAVSDTDVQAKSSVESTKQISPQLASFAKRERALQIREKELAEKEKSVGQNPNLDSLKQRAQSGQALRVLEELGIPKDELYKRLTDEILGNPQDTTAPLLAKIEQLEKSIDERLAKKDSDQEQAVYDHMTRNIGIMARTNPEFRLIKESESEGDVLELIKHEWKTNGIILDEEEACKRIELELREDAKRYAGIIGELEQPPKTQVEQTREPVEQRFKTLTNKDSARPAMSRRQRAIAAALGQK